MRYFFSLILTLLLLACNSKKGTGEFKNPDDSVDVNVAPVSKLKYDLTVSTDKNDLEKAKKIDENFKRYYSRHQFNGAVLVAEKGKIIYKNSFGFANFQNEVKVTDSTEFHLASVSKQFTAMGIMILHDEGKLKFDDPISKYLPGIPYNNVTIRHLLNHTSGIQNIVNYVPNFLMYWDSCAIASTKDLTAIFAKQNLPLRHTPGKRFSYNNTGYILLASIIEHVSGMSYRKFIEQKIFAPLGMHYSQVFDWNDQEKIKNRAIGYGPYRGGHSVDDDDIRNGMVGEKGVYSSIIDMYKWDQALYTEVLVKKKTLEEAFKYAVLTNGNKINYGFGWRKSRDDEDIVYHFGHWRGFNTCIIRFTDDKNTIIILTNTGNRHIKPMVASIYKIIYGNQDFPKL